MTESLIDELRKVGLTLNFKKTKILYSHLSDDDAHYSFAEISGDFVKILKLEEYHRYLGRYISFSDTRCKIELDHRIQQAWAMFHKHKKCILNKHVSLRNRLKYFDACVTPVLLFALVVLPMSQSKLDLIDRLQRKMLR